MSQIDMFSTFDQAERSEPLARKTDPEASHEAAAEIAPKAGTLRDRMLEVISAVRAGRTANEAASICVERFGGSHESYRKRAGELEKRGLIKSTYSCKCSVTGKSAGVYVRVK